MSKPVQNFEVHVGFDYSRKKRLELDKVSRWRFGDDVGAVGAVEGADCGGEEVVPSFGEEVSVE
jgi:hypothetical protein